MRACGAVLLQRRLGDAEGVDARVYDLHGVLRCADAEVGLGAVGYLPSDRVAARGRGPGVRVEVVDLARELVAYLLNLRRVICDEDDAVGVIFLVNLRAHLLHVVALLRRRLLHAVGGRVGQLMQVVGHLHLYHEVRAAAEVEAEVYVLAQRVLEARRREVFGRRLVPRPHDDPEAHERHDGDDDDALKKILFHNESY